MCVDAFLTATIAVGGPAITEITASKMRANITIVLMSTLYSNSSFTSH